MRPLTEMRPSRTICSTLRRESTPALASTFWMRSFTRSYLPDAGRVGYARGGVLLVVGDVGVEDAVVDLPTAQRCAQVDGPSVGARGIFLLRIPGDVTVFEE